jgi:hypothetical protein
MTCQQPGISGSFELSFNNVVLDYEGRTVEKIKRFVWPQYLVEPQYIEGYVEDIQIVQSDSLVSGRTIPSLCSLALNVLGCRPRIAAAPSFPSMRHRVSARVLRI